MGPDNPSQSQPTTAQQLEAIYRTHMMNQLATQEANFRKREEVLQREIEKLQKTAVSAVPVPL